MDILGSAIDIMSTGGVGSLIGLVGGYFTKRQEAKYQEANNKHKLLMRELDIQESKLDRKHELDKVKAGIEQAQAEGDIKADLQRLENHGQEMAEENKAFAMSQKYGNQAKGVMSWVRPGITLFLLFAGTFLIYQLWQAVDGLTHFKPDELTELLTYSVKTTLFAVNTAIFWWFGQKWSSSKKHI